MGNSIRIEIQNLDEVKALIAKRPELARAVADEAIEAAARVILGIAKTAAPGPGLDYERVGEAVYEVGPVKAKWYYRFHETGTSSHLVLPRRMRALKIGGEYAASAHPGGMPAAPFLRPAIDEGREKAADAAGEVWARAVE